MHVLNRARCWAESERSGYLAEGPVERPAHWLAWVNQPLTDLELQAHRRNVNRGTPYGNDAWARETAKRLGLETTLRPPRPAKEGEKDK